MLAAFELNRGRFGPGHPELERRSKFTVQPRTKNGALAFLHQAAITKRRHRRTYCLSTSIVPSSRTGA